MLSNKLRTRWLPYRCGSKHSNADLLRAGFRGLTKAAANASRHKLAHVNNEVLSQIDAARGVNEEWLQGLNDKDATAVRNGNVVVLSWCVQQDLKRQPKRVSPSHA